MRTARTHHGRPFVAPPVPHYLAMLHVLSGALPFRFVLGDGPGRAPRLRTQAPRRHQTA